MITMISHKTDATLLADDLSFLEGYLWFRKTLSERLCEASVSQDESILSVVRIGAAAQFVEFLFLLKARGLVTAEQMEALANAHNAYLIALSKDTSKMERLGITADRLLNAMFTGDTLPRLTQQWRERPGAIDQSNIARLLSVTMSTETCRKVVVAFAQASFLNRVKTGYGTGLVMSTGVAEEIFGTTLREARLKLMNPGDET